MIPTIPGKFLFRLIDERAGSSNLPLLSVSRYHGVIPRSDLTEKLSRAEDLSNYKVCEPGDIIVNRMSAYQGAMGRSALAGLVSPDYMVLRPGPQVISQYLHYLFRSAWFTGEIIQRLRGIGSVELGNVRTPRINPDDFGSIPIPVPPLEEQRRIADLLDTEVARIGRIEKLAERAGQLALDRRTAVIDAELAEISDHYVAPVTSVCEIVLDCVNKTAPLSIAETPYRMIRTSNVRRGNVDVEETFRVTEETFHRWNRRGTPQVGDLLFTRQAPVGEAGLLLSSAPVFLGQQVMLYRPNRERISPEFLLYNFLSSFMKEQFVRASDGAAHTHMRVHDCLKLRAYCPPLEQQDRVVARVRRALGHSDALRAVTTRQLSLLAERRQALITAAVTGQFDVSTAGGRNVTDGVSA
ncbi:restriction endonuclease subunit S [Streptomyces sp. NPDC001930]|uniref:restriction endonuclease subunit S n=1 Tax=Streptomyces sp. NPDC001930 TaxID=3364625 RepID=UPI0036A768D2